MKTSVAAEIEGDKDCGNKSHPGQEGEIQGGRVAVSKRKASLRGEPSTDLPRVENCDPGTDRSHGP